MSSALPADKSWLIWDLTRSSSHVLLHAQCNMTDTSQLNLRAFQATEPCNASTSTDGRPASEQDAAHGPAAAAAAGCDAERYSFWSLSSSGALAGFLPLAQLEAGFDLRARTARRGAGVLGVCFWQGQPGAVFRCAHRRQAP